jgi:hypothetical protein
MQSPEELGREKIELENAIRTDLAGLVYGP